jgi:hypothetical protein
MRRLAPLAAVIALIAAAPALSGCGAEEVAGVDVAQAAQATAGKGTARVHMTMSMEGLGLPAGLSLDADGVMSLTEPEGDLTLDLGSLLGAAGVDGNGDLKLRFGGGELYVDPPELAGLDIPDGWLAIHLREVVEALGIDPDAAASLFTVDASSQLRALRAAGKLEDAGDEEIDGVATRHLKGAYSLNDILAGLPPAKADKLRDALDQLDKLQPNAMDRDRNVPVELWIDDDDVFHRMKTEAELPGQNGAPAGHMSVTMDLSDFGVPLDVSRPEGATDVTDELVGVLEQQGAVLGRSGQRGG